VRRQFERRFSADRMARDYIEIYKALTGRETLRKRKPSAVETLGDQPGELVH
jgi:hypothetical protein